MNTNNYGKLGRGRRLKLKRRITGLIIAALIICVAAFIIGKLTENSAEYQLRASLVEENRVLREQVTDLQAQIDGLKNELSEKNAYIESIPTAAPEDETATEEPSPTPQAGGTPRSNARQ